MFPRYYFSHGYFCHPLTSIQGKELSIRIRYQVFKSGTLYIDMTAYAFYWQVLFYQCADLLFTYGKEFLLNIVNG